MRSFLLWIITFFDSFFRFKNHSLINAFIISLIHAFAHYSFTHSFMHSVKKSLSRSFVHTFIHPFIHSIILSFIHSFIHSFIYSSFAVSFVQFVFLISQDYAFKNWSYMGLRPLFFRLFCPGAAGEIPGTRHWPTNVEDCCAVSRRWGCKESQKKEKTCWDIRMYQSVLFHGAFTKSSKISCFFCIHIVTSWCLKWVCKVGLYHSAQLHCRVFPNSVGFVWNLGAPEISMVYHSVASSNSFQVGVYPHFQAHLDLNVWSFLVRLVRCRWQLCMARIRGPDHQLIASLQPWLRVRGAALQLFQPWPTTVRDQIHWIWMWDDGSIPWWCKLSHSSKD